jgi:hypothetical protein
LKKLPTLNALNVKVRLFYAGPKKANGFTVVPIIPNVLGLPGGNQNNLNDNPL